MGRFLVAHEAKVKGRSRSTRATGRVCSISSRIEAEEALLDQKQDATPAREMAGALRQGEARLRQSQQGAARARDPAGPRPRRQRRMEAEVMGGHEDVELVQFEPTAIDYGV